MIVYKFGGATTRTRRGLDALTELVAAAQRSEVTRRKRSRDRTASHHGLVLVISAIGHTTRHLARAAELSATGNLALAEDALERTIEQHRQLLRSLKLDAEEEVLERFNEIGDRVSALMEGVAITRELSARSRDAIVAHGEALATAIIEAALHEHGLPVHVVDARQIIATNDTFGHALPNYHEIKTRVTRLVLPRLRRSEIVLTQGYIGATPEGDTTTMGSESSDLTATLIAGALAAEEVVIWKTVQGIYTADPELVPEAKLIKSLSFEEAEEIGRRGARILFPAVAHPILREEHDTVMRIATPMGRSERHTEMQRTLPAPRQEKPLGVAVDQNLLELRIRRALQAAPVITDAAHKRLGLERVLAEAAHVWFSGSEVRAIIPRERRSDLQSRLAASGWTVFAAEPVSAIGVVVRTPTLKQGTVQEQKTMSTVVKSLRGFPVRAIFAIESSIVAVVEEPSVLAALRKLHKDLFAG
jgi:aspartate kinase